MLSLNQLRKIDPELRNLSDDEVLKIRDSFYELGQIIYEDWGANGGSKNPVGGLAGIYREREN